MDGEYHAEGLDERGIYGGKSHEPIEERPVDRRHPDYADDPWLRLARAPRHLRRDEIDAFVKRFASDLPRVADRFAVGSLDVVSDVPRAEPLPLGRAMEAVLGLPVYVDETLPPNVLEARNGDLVLARIEL